MDNHIIINVGRQVGAGGLEIGRLLAQDFDAKFYDRELLNLAAKESGFSEKIFKLNDEKKGFFKGLFNVQTPHLLGGNLYNSNFSQESLFQFQSDAIRKAAAEGSCVFLLCRLYTARLRQCGERVHHSLDGLPCEAGVEGERAGCRPCP